MDIGQSVGQTSTAGAAGLIRNNTSADTSPYTQARMFVYGGPGVDTGNYGYFAYGADAIMRLVYGHVGGSPNLSFGVSTASDGTGTYTEKMRLDGSGNVTGVYGNYHVSSDIRRKKDIVTIPNALEKVLSLRGVNFRWKDSKPDDNLHMGMIAQEVEKVVPEVVHTADDEMKTKAVEYQYVVGLLVEAIKAQQQIQQQQQSQLQDQLQKQQREIENLKAEIHSLKGKL